MDKTTERVICNGLEAININLTDIAKSLRVIAAHNQFVEDKVVPYITGNYGNCEEVNSNEK